MQNKVTKTQKVLDYLKGGGVLTPLVAWKVARTLCCAEIIRELKKKGYRFDTRYVVENGARYGTYKLITRSK